MRKYEIMLILPPGAEDATVTGATDRIGQVLAPDGGEITNVDRWGKRRLAYEIDHHAEGYYVVVEATAQPTTMKELDRVLSLADDVVRFKVVVREEPRARASAA